jgi:hypothetical protein
MGPQNRESPKFENFGGVPGQNVIWMWPSWRSTKYNIRGKVVGFVCLSLPVARPSTKSVSTMH